MAKHSFNPSQVPNVTWMTLNNILRDCGTNGVAMYLRYVYVANLKMTNQPRITTDYMENGLGWGRDKVQKVRKQLDAFGYITIIKERDDHGYLSKTYVKVNKIVTFKKMQFLEPENTVLGSQSLEPDFTAEVKHGTNINLKDNNLNNLKDIEEDEDSKNIFAIQKLPVDDSLATVPAPPLSMPAVPPHFDKLTPNADVNEIIAFAKEKWEDEEPERITPVTLANIKKILKAGYTVADFKKAIDYSTFWSGGVPRTLSVMTKTIKKFDGFVNFQDRTSQLADEFRKKSRIYVAVQE